MLESQSERHGVFFMNNVYCRLFLIEAEFFSVIFSSRNKEYGIHLSLFLRHTVLNVNKQKYISFCSLEAQLHTSESGGGGPGAPRPSDLEAPVYN